MTSYCGLPVYSLRDVVQEIDAPHSTCFEDISSKWQCVIAPRIPLQRNNINNDICRTNFTAIKYLDAGVAIQWPALPHLRTSVKTRKTTSEVTSTSTTTTATTNNTANTTSKEKYTDDELVDSKVRHSDGRSIAASNINIEEKVRVNEKAIERNVFSNHDQAAAKWREYNNTFCFTSNGWVDAQFTRSQIAMRNGWDAPGESMTTSRYHTLVSSIADVFNSSRRSHEVALPTQHEPYTSSTKINMKTALSSATSTENTVITKEECANNSRQLTKKCNTWDLYRSHNQLSNLVELQYFYRKDCREDDVQLPRFADNFTWPQLFDDTCAKFSFVGESSVIASERGAIRRWHISDDGEFTMQAVLCAAEGKAKCKTNTTSLRDDNYVHINSIENKCCKYTPPTVNIQNYDETSVKFAANCKQLHDTTDKCNITADKMYKNKQGKIEKLEEEEEEEEESSLLTSEAKERSRQIRSLLYQENDCQDATSVPARLVICGAKYSYDWFIHDDESNVEGVHASLDLLYTPDEAFPSDKELLPILTVAVIMSNSPYALLLPPNLPHMSITLNDSIIIEQSRISELWLDDLTYFMHRCQHWVGQPVMYEYLANNLQDDHFVGGELIPKLIYFFDNVDKLLADDVTQNFNMINAIKDVNTDDHNTISLSHKTYSNVSDNIFMEYCAIVRKRIVMSLLAIAHNKDYFELNASSRASLMHLLHSNNDDKNNRSEIAVIAASSMWTHCNNSDKQGTSPIIGTCTSVETFLCEYYWNTEKWWPKPGCVMRIPVRSISNYNSHMYLPVIYVQHRPVFGTEKSSIEETVCEYFEMKELADKPESLFKYLATRKQHHDALLDDLF